MTLCPITSKGSAAAKSFRRSMLAQGTYQADSASERSKLGQNGPMLEGSASQDHQADPGTGEAVPGSRQMAWVIQCSPVTVRTARRWPALNRRV